MKIAILVDQIEPALGGAVGVSFQQVRGLALRGHEVTVIAANGQLPAISGVQLRRIAASFPERYRAYLGLHHPAAVRQVRRILRERKPDVVHAHNLYQALSYRCLREALQVTPKVFFTAHDVQSFAYAKLTHFITPSQLDCPPRPNYHTSWRVNLATAKKRYNPFRNLVIRRHLCRISKVFAVSQALADALTDNGITKVTVLRNGIELGDWQANDAAAIRFRRQHRLTGRKVLLFSGRISGAKGINQILAALARVVRRVGNTTLVIAGGAEGSLQAYRELPQKFGVSNHVVFTGQLTAPDMISAYQACDVVVVPSVCFDSFPSVNLEAMAAGKPIVVTCFGGSREAVVNGETGYIVNPYDITTLADRIQRLLVEPELALRLGHAGRRRVEQEFSAARWLDQLEAWYAKP